MNNFQLKPRHFLIMLRDSGSNLNLFWQNSPNITLVGKMGMVPPHHWQVGVEMQVLHSLSRVTWGGSTSLWGKVRVQAPHLIFTDTSLARSGGSASFLLPWWPPLIQWGQGDRMITAGLWGQFWPSITLLSRHPLERGRGHSVLPGEGGSPGSPDSVHGQPVGLGGRESHYPMMGMKVSPSYLIFHNITLAGVRGVGTPCFSLVRVEVEVSYSAFVGRTVVEAHFFQFCLARIDNHYCLNVFLFYVASFQVLWLERICFCWPLKNNLCLWLFPGSCFL